MGVSGAEENPPVTAMRNYIGPHRRYEAKRRVNDDDPCSLFRHHRAAAFIKRRVLTYREQIGDRDPAEGGGEKEERVIRRRGASAFFQSYAILYNFLLIQFLICAVPGVRICMRPRLRSPISINHFFCRKWSKFFSITTWKPQVLSLKGSPAGSNYNPCGIKVGGWFKVKMDSARTKGKNLFLLVWKTTVTWFFVSIAPLL